MGMGIRGVVLGASLPHLARAAPRVEILAADYG